MSIDNKPSDEILKQRLDLLLRHIGNVRENTEILGERLILAGNEELGRQLIGNGLIHDNSKFYGIEWDYLHGDVKESHPDLFKLAADQHIKNNLHHPESWNGGISEMSSLYLAEFVCDTKSRSQEFGNDIWEWIRDKAIKKYKFSKKGRVYQDLKHFLDLLLEPKFT